MAVWDRKSLNADIFVQSPIIVIGFALCNRFPMSKPALQDAENLRQYHALESLLRVNHWSPHPPLNPPPPKPFHP